MLSEAERRFVDAQRLAHLATADRRGTPHVVPVCFTVLDATLYIAIDEKPKLPSARPLKRLRNLAENPQAAVTIDRYDEDWRRLAWVMLRGPAEILAAEILAADRDPRDEHRRAQAALQARYRQLAAMNIAALPVIALRIARVTSWGDLTLPQAASGPQAG